jgi:hypothetical protein
VSVPVGDEAAYLRQARTIRRYGVRRGFARLAERYLASKDEQQYPSPLRWLWILALAATHRWHIAVPVLCALCLAGLGALHFGWMAGAIVATSPLLWIVSRRSLQDSLVALLTVAALLAAYAGSPVWLELALFAGLAVKEVSPLTWPAVALVWWVNGAPWMGLLAAFAIAVSLWVTSVAALFKGSLSQRMTCAALTSHATDYTKSFQRGGLHRLAIDLALLSPLAVAAAILVQGPLVALATVLIATHALSPVNNARTIVAADALLRCAAVALGPVAVACMVAVDLWVIWRTKEVYDPVTANLTAALGMSPKK